MLYILYLYMIQTNPIFSLHALPTPRISAVKFNFSATLIEFHCDISDSGIAKHKYSW